MEEAVTQGLSGLTVYGPLGFMVMGLIAFHLRKENDWKQERLQYQAEIERWQAKVDAERKVNADLQQLRHEEMKTNLTVVSQNTTAIQALVAQRAKE